MTLTQYATRDEDDDGVFEPDSDVLLSGFEITNSGCAARALAFRQLNRACLLRSGLSTPPGLTIGASIAFADKDAGQLSSRRHCQFVHTAHDLDTVAPPANVPSIKPSVSLAMKDVLKLHLPKASTFTDNPPFAPLKFTGTR